MKEKTSRAIPREKPVVRDPGKVARAFSFFMALVSALVLAVCISVVIEWTGIGLQWWPGDHAMQLLLQERGYIEAIDDYPLAPLTPLGVSLNATQAFDSLWQALWSSTSLGEYATAAINTVRLVLLRLVVSLFTLPGFILIVLAAFFDGLVARDIRKYTGGHESSYVFHKAKRWVIPSLIVTISLYLMLPFSIPPVVIFAPSMALTGVMIFVATSRFKKFV